MDKKLISLVIELVELDSIFKASEMLKFSGDFILSLIYFAYLTIEP
jgi:hypothetical protein